MICLFIHFKDNVKDVEKYLSKTTQMLHFTIITTNMQIVVYFITAISVIIVSVNFYYFFDTF